jgi:hypothetical protein
LRQGLAVVAQADLKLAVLLPPNLALNTSGMPGTEQNLLELQGGQHLVGSSYKDSLFIPKAKQQNCLAQAILTVSMFTYQKLV